MKFNSSIATALLTVLIVGCSSLEPPAPGTITGVAHGAKHWNSPDTGPPMAGRELTLINANDGSIVKRVKTDSAGRFTFSVSPGTYSIWGGERADPIHVDSGQTITTEITVPES
jgi:hypothetical protein